LTSAELARVALALAQVAPVEGRLRLKERAGIVVIDDTYNSNPRSLRGALAAAREVADSRKARLVIAIGDMLELGELSANAHREALSDLHDVRPAAGILTGPEMTDAFGRASTAERPPSMIPTANSVEAALLITNLVRPGDVLLVKGSRGMAMERVIAALLH
jgi:UDP-N-acetylmuramoyl-tripeptide--D-alanyl-D-alanine ligase